MANFKNSGSVERISLLKQNYFIDSAKKEIAVILFSGQFAVNGHTLTRKNVFDDKVTGFFLANQGACEILVSHHAEFCVIQSKSNATIELSIINYDQVVTRQAGVGNFKRTVETVLDKTNGFENLIIGETTKDAGNWSSWPPHKHDTYIPNVQSEQKEIYLYKFSKPNGFGIQLIYDDDIEEATTNVVVNNSEIKIGKGYHPVVGSPDSKMYYLWALFGDNNFFKVYSDLVYGD